MIIVLWLHLLAAVTWIGGMLFLSVVLVPIFKRKGFAGEHKILFQELAFRFRKFVWASILILLLTGLSLLVTQMSPLTEFDRWPIVLKVKLVLVVFLIALTAAHDFWIGPLVVRIKREAISDTPVAQQFLVTLSPWIARLGLVLALGILLLGIAVARE